MKEKYLPIGTVVTLKEGTKKIMIIGFCPINDKKEMFDYTGCPFPEGIIAPDKVVAFNHTSIKEIFHMGIENDETIKFNNVLYELVKNMENIKDVKFPASSQAPNV